MASIRPLPRDELSCLVPSAAGLFWARGQNWQNGKTGKIGKTGRTSPDPQPAWSVPVRAPWPGQFQLVPPRPQNLRPAMAGACPDRIAPQRLGPLMLRSPTVQEFTVYATTTGGLAVRSARMDSSTQPSLSVLVPSFSLEDTGQVLTVLARVGQGCSLFFKTPWPNSRLCQTRVMALPKSER